MKTTQNTIIDEIDILRTPATETMMFRYFLAASYCKGKNVLDASTGYGYGATILKALGAKTVTGIDIDEDALNYARENYEAQFKNGFISFEKIDLTTPESIPIENCGYDTIISIETFEHLPKESIKIYLENLKRALLPGGQIFITTPRRIAPEWKYTGGTHLYEYNAEEFCNQIYEVFNQDKIKFFGIDEQWANKQLISLLNDTLINTRIMCAHIIKHG